MQRAWIAGFVLMGASALAQAPPTPATMKQLMVDLIHPASNDLLLIVYRGGPKDEKEWAAVRHSALTVAESGNLLAARRADNAGWIKAAQLLAGAGTAAYKAAQAKDANALAVSAEALDGSCTTCHKQYRPNVFPRDEGGGK